MPVDYSPLLSHGITSQSSYQEQPLTIKTSNLNIRISQIKAMRIQRRHAPTISMANCGRKLIPNVAPVLAITKSGARFSGTQSCNNQHCPNCMAASRQKRIDSINQGIKGAQKRKMKVFFNTFTCPRSSNAKEQANHLSYGFKCFIDKLTYRLRKQGNALYFVRANDVTFRIEQREIYHQHLHNILAIKKPFQSYTEYRYRSIEDTEYFLRNGFNFNNKNKLVVSSFDECVLLCWYDVNKTKDIKISFQAQDVQEVRPGKKSRTQLSQYLLKFWSMGQEMACFAHKEGKHGKLTTKYRSMSFMQLMGWIEQGHPRSIAIYQEYLKAMYGHRTIGKSHNWKDLIDDEEEEEEEEKPPEIVFSFSFEWFHLIQNMNNAHKNYCATDSFLVTCFSLYNTDRIDRIEKLFMSSPTGDNLKIFLKKYCPL